MRIITILSWAFVAVMLVMVVGLASCSNPDERPMDTIFEQTTDPLPKSPIGFIVSDPAFRQMQPDPLIEEQYQAAALTPMTTHDLWNFFSNATTRVDLVGTRITNSGMVARLVALANKGVDINIVTEQGFFGDSESSPFISQLAQTGRVTMKTDKDGIARQVHSAYAIIDDHIVLSSSGDFLAKSFNNSINDIMVIDTPRTYVNGAGAAGVKTITDAFLFDFDQMFNMGRFGGDKERLINHSFNIGSQVEVYFGPNDNLLAEIIDEINNAQVTITYMVGQVTDQTMHLLMRDLFDGGYFDGTVNDPGFQDPDDDVLFLETGIPFNWSGYNALNHKLLIIDVPIDFSNQINPIFLDFFDPVVIAGSANWTQNGLKLNDEQMLIIHDLTLGFEVGSVEMGTLGLQAPPPENPVPGYGVLFGRLRTFKNVPIDDGAIACDSEMIPGSPFLGDGGNPSVTNSLGEGVYAMAVPAGFLRNIRVVSLGSAEEFYLYPIPLWGEDSPNDGYNLLPGASYEANFYVSPRPSATGTGGGGDGGFGG